MTGPGTPNGAILNCRRNASLADFCFLRQPLRLESGGGKWYKGTCTYRRPVAPPDRAKRLLPKEPSDDRPPRCGPPALHCFACRPGGMQLRRPARLRLNRVAD